MMAASRTSTHSGDPAELPADLCASSDAGRPAVTAVSSPAAETLPLLDPAVLKDLTEDLGVPAMSRQFVRDYAGLWGQRKARLKESLEKEDLAVALDAVISLKVTSAMVGGSRLAHLAQTLEAALRQGNFAHAPTLLALIAAHGQDTMAEIERLHGLPSA